MYKLQQLTFFNNGNQTKSSSTSKFTFENFIYLYEIDHLRPTLFNKNLLFNIYIPFNNNHNLYFITLPKLRTNLKNSTFHWQNFYFLWLVDSPWNSIFNWSRDRISHIYNLSGSKSGLISFSELWMWKSGFNYSLKIRFKILIFMRKNWTCTYLV